MADIQPNFTPEFVITFRDMMLQGMQMETQTTKKVLAAVPDSGHDYRPDPKARSAKEYPSGHTLISGSETRSETK